VKHLIIRASLVLAAAGMLLRPVAAEAADPVEKPKLAIATASLGLTYLPLILAQQLGYFKDQGLTVEVSAFPGGSKALEALMGGSVDIVSGAYSNTLTMAAKDQALIAFVAQVRCPGFVLGISKAHPDVTAASGMKGLKVGVSAPGSSTHMVLNYILNKGGLHPDDVSVIGVGTSSGAVAAVRTGQIDAMINNDPILTILTESGDLHSIADMRSEATNAAVFGGPYPEASFYSKADFVRKNPKTVQAVTNAVVKAEHWLQKATPDDVASAVPEDYLLGDRALYIKAFNNMRACLSPDGMLNHEGAAIVLHVLSDFDADIRGASIKLEDTYDDSFAKRANAALQ
jgi:NitT/TauT family transport system substrate-binding protein